MTAPGSRAPSLAAMIGSVIGPGVTIVACSLPSATIQSPETSSEAQATKTEGAKTKAKRKATARGRRPEIIEAELLGEGEHLRLHFSEPLAPTEGVDPNDFRLSLGMAYIYRTYAYAYYYDPGEMSGEELMEITAMRGQSDILELYLDPPFLLEYCGEIEREVADMRSEPGVRADGGVFLHYAPGDKPITDIQGNGLDAIAAEWVLRKRRGGDDAYEMYFEGAPARRALREPIRVRCGPELPPGPR